MGKVRLEVSNYKSGENLEGKLDLLFVKEENWKGKERSI